MMQLFALLQHTHRQDEAMQPVYPQSQNQGRQTGLYRIRTALLPQQQQQRLQRLLAHLSCVVMQLEYLQLQTLVKRKVLSMKTCVDVLLLQLLLQLPLLHVHREDEARLLVCLQPQN